MGSAWQRTRRAWRRCSRCRRSCCRGPPTSPGSTGPPTGWNRVPLPTLRQAQLCASALGLCSCRRLEGHEEWHAFMLMVENTRLPGSAAARVLAASSHLFSCTRQQISGPSGAPDPPTPHPPTHAGGGRPRHRPGLQEQAGPQGALVALCMLWCCNAACRHQASATCSHSC